MRGGGGELQSGSNAASASTSCSRGPKIAAGAKLRDEGGQGSKGLGGGERTPSVDTSTACKYSRSLRLHLAGTTVITNRAQGTQEARPLDGEQRAETQLKLAVRHQKAGKTPMFGKHVRQTCPAVPFQLAIRQAGKWAPPYAITLR